jgi:rfaE bifunctional protein kinase chain/domain
MAMKYNEFKIAVIGDFMIDRWEHGEILRVNPEAPTLDFWGSSGYSQSLGGAGNLLMCLDRLGAEVIPIAVVGDDYEGDMIIEILDCSEIETRGIHRCGKRCTTSKTRYVVDGQQTFRRSVEIHDELSDIDFKLIKGYFNDYATDCDAVVVGDQNKGVMSLRVIEFVMNFGKEHNIPVMVDPKFDNFWEYKGATIFKPNEQEWISADSKTYTHPHIFGNMVITKGGAGMEVRSLFGHTIEFIPAHNVEVADVTGAGDEVMAVLTLEYLRTKDIMKAAELANVAGSLVVQKHRTVRLTSKELWEAARVCL